MHIPGNNPNKRKIEKGQQQQESQAAPTAYFADDFIPARGYALIECRFIGASALLHIPDSVHSEQQFAIVRAMGEGKHHYNGSIIEPEWKAGDFVYAAIANGRKIEISGKKLVVLGTEFIIGKFPTVPQAVIDEFANQAAKEQKPAAEDETAEPPQD